MSEELVYQLTREIWLAADRLAQEHPCLKIMQDRTFVCRDLPIPLHAGAQTFYQEQNIL